MNVRRLVGRDDAARGDAEPNAVAPAPTWTGAPGWREFLDLLSDAVVVFDRRAVVVLANTAALRLLPCEAGMLPEQLEPALGRATVDWLRRAAAGEGGAADRVEALLANGRRTSLAWRRLDDSHGALHLLPQVGSPGGWLLPATSVRPSAPPPPPAPYSAPMSADGIREAIGLFWDSPFPSTLQGADYRFVDVNQAFLDFSGYSREQLVGHDPKELQPPEDWGPIEARRERLAAGAGAVDQGLTEGRMIDASGRDRRYRVARRVLRSDDGRVVYLAVLQDGTAEHVAREQADRSLRELDDWFDLSPIGMVLFDDRGFLLRTNLAFHALAGGSPEQSLLVSLTEAPEALRRLLLWDDAAALARLQPDAGAIHGQAGFTPAGSTDSRALRSIVRCYLTLGGRRRYMAVVEDRSVEEERDLAQMQIGALIDTAGVGIATFHESSGWVRQRRTGDKPSPTAAEPAASAALQNISRDLVTPETLPEYQKLQHALRHAQRAELRYAIDHPELGQRWLLTRVEPATLASGTRTTSVVTLDVTEQHQSQQHGEQLLRELSTILESTTAGIAYFRGDALVRCNRRFETMLGLPTGSVAGRSVEALFGGDPGTRHIPAEAWEALGEGSIYETEFDRAVAGSATTEVRWYALSIRRGGAEAATAAEAIAVLTDVTRLKTQQRELEVLARDRELMFSLSGVGIAFIRDGRVERANPALAQLAGCSVEALSRVPLAELFVDESDYLLRWPQAERELRLHGRWSGERQLRVQGGRLLWVQVSKRLVRPGDLAGGMIASYVNVDARYLAEKAVALQADRTRAILDSVLVGIVTVGPQGIEWMNRSARRMFGGDLADFINLPIATVATADPDHPFTRTEYLTELVEGQAETFECRVQARDGREFWIVGNVVSIARESTGRQLTYALLDIERRREAEAQVSEAQASLQRIIEAAPLAITLRDAQSLRILQTNGVAAESAGRARESLIGSAPEDSMTPVVAAQHRQDMEAALASRDVTRREYRMMQRGEPRIWDARYLPLAADPAAPPDLLLMVATDVTEQRAAQEARLEAAIAQRDMLVKEVHHRIKNNLQGVAGLLQQIALRKPEVAGPIAEVVGQVHAIAQVYGLQVGSGGALQVASVVEAITASVQRTFGRSIRCVVMGNCGSATLLIPPRGADDAGVGLGALMSKCGSATLPIPPRGADDVVVGLGALSDDDIRQWVLPESESIPIALTLNELLTNALKHSAATPLAEVVCTLECSVDEVVVRIANVGRLAGDFDLARIPGGVSGLGLVRALLPRRSAVLTLEQAAEQVVATVRIRPPAVARSPSAG